MHFREKVRRDLKSWERENFKNTQTFYYWPRNNWENQVLPRSELQTPGRPVWPASRAELRCQTNNFFAKQLICSQRILATRQYNKRSQYMPAFFGDLRLRDFSLLSGCKCTGNLIKNSYIVCHLLLPVSHSIINNIHLNIQNRQHSYCSSKDDSKKCDIDR